MAIGSSSGVLLIEFYRLNPNELGGLEGWMEGFGSLAKGKSASDPKGNIDGFFGNPAKGKSASDPIELFRNWGGGKSVGGGG